MEAHTWPYLLSALESGSVAGPGPEPQDLLGTDGTVYRSGNGGPEGWGLSQGHMSKQKADDLPGMRRGRATTPVPRDQVCRTLTGESSRHWLLSWDPHTLSARALCHPFTAREGGHHAGKLGPQRSGQLSPPPVGASVCFYTCTPPALVTGSQGQVSFLPQKVNTGS